MLSEELGLQEFLEDTNAPVLVALGRSFHHHGTTHEKSLDCLEHGVGTTRRQSQYSLGDQLGGRCSSVSMSGACCYVQNNL